MGREAQLLGLLREVVDVVLGLAHSSVVGFADLQLDPDQFLASGPSGQQVDAAATGKLGFGCDVGESTEFVELVTVGQDEAAQRVLVPNACLDNARPFIWRLRSKR